METIIVISGQIGGNFKLLSALSNYEEKHQRFNNFTLVYKSKKDAIEDLSNARTRLKNDDCEYSYTRGYRLSYDASSAEILQDKII